MVSDTAHWDQHLWTRPLDIVFAEVPISTSFLYTTDILLVSSHSNGKQRERTSMDMERKKFSIATG